MFFTTTWNQVIKSLGHIFVHVCVKLDQFLQILGVNMTEVFATHNIFSNLLKQHPPKHPTQTQKVSVQTLLGGSWHMETIVIKFSYNPI